MTKAKLYACCANAKCKKRQVTLDFLKLWGLPSTSGTDKQGTFFDVTPPDYWLGERRKTFVKALERVKVQSKH